MTITTKRSLDEVDMAKSFTNDDRIKIKEDIMNIAKDLFDKTGYKKTTVNLITEKAGIAKGSFYSFFSSKEALFFHILQKYEKRITKYSIKSIEEKLIKHDFITALIKSIKEIFESLEKENILKISVDQALIKQIWSKLSEEEIEMGREQDIARVREFIRLANDAGYYMTAEEDMFQEVLRSYLFVYINRNVIGNGSDSTMDFIMESTLKRIFKKR